MANPNPSLVLKLDYEGLTLYVTLMANPNDIP